MNALKHGRRSRQFAELGALVAQSPVARETLLAISKRWDMQTEAADYVAARILATMITRGINRGADGSFAISPVADGRSIIENARAESTPNPARPTKKEKIPPDNQKPSSPRANNLPQIQNPNDRTSKPH
jgi:hypothetical protein